MPEGVGEVAGVDEVVGVGEENRVKTPDGSLGEGEGVRRTTTFPGSVLDGTEREGSSGIIDDELSGGMGDWVGFKKTVEVTVMVTRPRFGGVEEEGLTGGVEDGLKSGSTEDGSTGRVEEGLKNGSTEAGSIESTEGGEEEEV
jgi:hypothetical protein